MPVVVSRIGQSGNARVEVTIDIADLLAAGVAGARLRAEAVVRAFDELIRARSVEGRTDAEIDAEAAGQSAAALARAAALKASRPTGNP